MTVIEGTPLSRRIGDPAIQSPNLDPNTSESSLQRAYYAMAQVVLELSKPTFPSIGALKFDLGVWKVGKRPLTLNMNELVRVGNYPPSMFSEHEFKTASEYFEDLATQQLFHLRYRRNNAVTDEQDCRKKYIARCLFRKIARQIPTEQDSFHLYCDDLRPSNVLVSQDFMITGFTYTAPWWLILESPEAWEADLDLFLHRYTPRLELFVKTLRACEDRQIKKGTLIESQRLSDRMSLSMKNGLFWFCLAARKSFMFDDIYWKFLDEKYFGNFTSLDDRLSLLTEDERNQLDEFVEMKMQQAEEKSLDEHMSLGEIIDF
ncbi:hypothetical protein F5884DRAFT_816124 [Xylogone sp. PMI_703]|nr:hypothetical protein F5884DRAFT_816124 [Xylogone sp. PMI_703]